MLKQTLVTALRKKPKRRDHRMTRRLRHHEMLEDRRVLATVSGHVIDDLNGNGEIETGEPGLGGVNVYIDENSNDMLDITGIVVEPDDFAAGEMIEVPGVTLAVQTEDGMIVDDVVVAIAESPGTGDFASTGDLVFGVGEDDFFNFASKLRISFESAVNSVTIDVLGSSQIAADIGLLEVYDGSDNLLEAVRTSGLCSSSACVSQIETLRIERTEGDISYALAYTERPRLTARFDALRINDGGSEPWTITNSEGAYEFRALDAGTYRINQVVPEGYQQTFPNGGGDGSQQVVVTDSDVSDVDFANVESVAEPPVARDDMAETVTGKSVTIDVLSNDGDANSILDPTSVLVVLDPTDGSAAVDAVTGEITYTPGDDFVGTDSLRYTVRDTNGQVSNEAIVSIEVTEFVPLWQNPVNALDVVDDGVIAPIDALRIINELNNPQYRDPETGELPDPPDPIPAYFDVDGDNFVAPVDAILIINFLNSSPAVAVRSEAMAEGEDEPEIVFEPVPPSLIGNIGAADVNIVFQPIFSEIVLDLRMDAEPISPFEEVISLTDLEQVFNLEDERNAGSGNPTTEVISLDDATAFILARNLAHAFV